MIIFRRFILLNIILFLSSCGTIKEGFTNQKKNSTDEFLVEKKLPLNMPPNYKELPIPNFGKEDSKKENKIKKMINAEKKTSINSENIENNNKNFENSLLEKIKDN
jgi:hypothetical protein